MRFTTVDAQPIRFPLCSEIFKILSMFLPDSLSLFLALLFSLFSRTLRIFGKALFASYFPRSRLIGTALRTYPHLLIPIVKFLVLVHSVSEVPRIYARCPFLRYFLPNLSYISSRRFLVSSDIPDGGSVPFSGTSIFCISICGVVEFES